MSFLNVWKFLIVYHKQNSLHFIVLFLGTQSTLHRRGNLLKTHTEHRVSTPCWPQ